MEQLELVLGILLFLAALAGTFYGYLKLASFLYERLDERGWIPNYYRRQRTAGIQTLFHGNTRDDPNRL